MQDLKKAIQGLQKYNQKDLFAWPMLGQGDGGLLILTKPLFIFCIYFCFKVLFMYVNALGVSPNFVSRRRVVKVSLVYEDFKFKVLDGLDQNWSFPVFALLAVSARLRQQKGQTQENFNFDCSPLKF